MLKCSKCQEDLPEFASEFVETRQGAFCVTCASSEIFQLEDMVKKYRKQVAKLTNKNEEFEAFVNLAISNTMVKVGGSSHWPDWLVEKLSKMGLWVMEGSDLERKDENV